MPKSSKSNNGSTLKDKPAADLKYRGALKPEIIKQQNGKFTVRGIPIFQTHTDRGWKCDDMWMEGAVNFQAQKKQEGFLPRLVKGHTDDSGDEKPAVAALDNYRYDGKGWLYADFVDVPEPLLDEFKSGSWPGRSVEVIPEDYAIPAVALLGGTAPYFTLPDLRFHAEASDKTLFYSMDYTENEVEYVDAPNTEPSAADKGYAQIKKYMDPEALRSMIREMVVQVMQDMGDEGSMDPNAAPGGPALAGGAPGMGQPMNMNAGYDCDENEMGMMPRPGYMGHNDNNDPYPRNKGNQMMGAHATDKLTENYDALKKQNDTLTGQVIALQEENERAKWTTKYTNARVARGRINIDEEVDFIMGLPADKREKYFDKSIKHAAPAPSTTALKTTDTAGPIMQGSEEERTLIREYYNANRDKYRGDYTKAVQDFRNKHQGKPDLVLTATA